MKQAAALFSLKINILMKKISIIDEDIVDDVVSIWRSNAGNSKEIDALINVRSLTVRIFTDKENGEGHCNVGNPKLCFDTMMNWIKQIKKRD